jgi:hypothetical protein
MGLFSLLVSLCLFWHLLSWAGDCICNTGMTNSKIEFFIINNSRVELRCKRCKGLVSWWNISARTKKIMTFKRAWSEEECLAMR